MSAVPPIRRAAPAWTATGHPCYRHPGVRSSFTSIVVLIVLALAAPREPAGEFAGALVADHSLRHDAGDDGAMLLSVSRDPRHSLASDASTRALAAPTLLAPPSPALDAPPPGHGAAPCSYRLAPRGARAPPTA